MKPYDEPNEPIRVTPSRGERRPIPSVESTTRGDEADTEDIRVEIEQTRTEMGGTIDAISQRLNPETITERATVVVQDVTEQAIRQAKEAALEVTTHALDEAKGAAREVTDHALDEAKETAREMTGQAKDAAWDATVGRAEEAVTTAGQTARGVGSIMLETIKLHPLPAALAGLSIGWLFMNRSSSPSEGASYRAYGAGRRSYVPPPTGVGYGSAGYRAGQAPYQDQGQSTVSGIADKVGETASQAAETVSDAAGSAAETASELARSATQKASAAATTTGEVASDTGTAIVQTIKDNPIPAALTGLGLVWLYKNRSGSSSAQTSYSSYGTGQTTYGPYGGETYDWSESRGTMQGLADTVGDTAGQVGDKAGELAGQAKGAAGDAVEQAQDGAKWAGRRVQQMLRTNPLMAGALAATVGGAVALALPETRREDQLLGKARDSVMGQAQEIKQETMEKVERVVEGAKEDAQDKGLTV